jgi:hypothetical protein
MAVKKQAEEQYKIDTLAENMNLDTAVFAGVKAFKGWANGKMATKKEFESAVGDFLGAPLRGKAVK